MKKRSTKLTPRQDEVMQLVAQGYSTKEVAGFLNLSVSTTDKHVGSVLRKFGAVNRVVAAVIYVRTKR